MTPPGGISTLGLFHPWIAATVTTSTMDNSFQIC
jgi:hypothetical protein